MCSYISIPSLQLSRMPLTFCLEKDTCRGSIHSAPEPQAMASLPDAHPLVNPHFVLEADNAPEKRSPCVYRKKRRINLIHVSAFRLNIRCLSWGALCPSKSGLMNKHIVKRIGSSFQD